MTEDRHPREPGNEEELAEAKEEIDDAKQVARENAETNEAGEVLPLDDPPWRESGYSPT
ncbi:hypothetical protein [Amycolatopsis palatopharyngis]|uniref:hypothetical protein n=1 Tax=Amycolatopsis palatopharyngis TaxID=187982 RepID=UPI0013BE9DA1|nr:hypothetical protein [Amycolatopsis palatopharyngis]